jgi:hypothetical protein
MSDTTELLMPESLDILIARVNSLRALLYFEKHSPQERQRIADMLSFWRAKLAERLSR